MKEVMIDYPPIVEEVVARALDERINIASLADTQVNSQCDAQYEQAYIACAFAWLENKAIDAFVESLKNRGIKINRMQASQHLNIFYDVDWLDSIFEIDGELLCHVPEVFDCINQKVAAYMA